MITALLLFTLWQAPNGMWTRTGEGSSTQAANPYEIIDRYCAQGTASVQVAHEGARLYVSCASR